MACKRSEQCEHADTCRDVKSNDYNIVGCSCYKKTLTNEEWRRTCSAEDFANWIAHKYTVLLCMQKHFKYVDEDTCLKCSLKEECRNEVEIPAYQMWLKWLKEKHNEM